MLNKDDETSDSGSDQNSVVDKDQDDDSLSDIDNFIDDSIKSNYIYENQNNSDSLDESDSNSDSSSNEIEYHQQYNHQDFDDENYEGEENEEPTRQDLDFINDKPIKHTKTLYERLLERDFNRYHLNQSSSNSVNRLDSSNLFKYDDYNDDSSDDTIIFKESNDLSTTRTITPPLSSNLNSSNSAINLNSPSLKSSNQQVNTPTTSAKKQGKVFETIVSPSVQPFSNNTNDNNTIPLLNLESSNNHQINNNDNSNSNDNGENNNNFNLEKEKEEYSKLIQKEENFKYPFKSIGPLLEQSLNWRKTERNGLLDNNNKATNSNSKKRSNKDLSNNNNNNNNNDSNSNSNNNNDNDNEKKKIKFIDYDPTVEIKYSKFDLKFTEKEKEVIAYHLIYYSNIVFSEPTHLWKMISDHFDGKHSVLRIGIYVTRKFKNNESFDKYFTKSYQRWFKDLDNMQSPLNHYKPNKQLLETSALISDTLNITNSDSFLNTQMNIIIEESNAINMVSCDPDNSIKQLKKLYINIPELFSLPGVSSLFREYENFTTNPLILKDLNNELKKWIRPIIQDLSSNQGNKIVKVSQIIDSLKLNNSLPHRNWKPSNDFYQLYQNQNIKKHTGLVSAHTLWNTDNNNDKSTRN
ncbi:hypothetical protein CYY_009881 [Polysphondylium violaceum]|uniref:Uncharacterized protein n=1 Tax=Polysphondylium violaceum TaxID=133409 RepID=A0A8J4PM83_9MYCE|nr:hypothetical protein CYY_009881 [Polysphondylium violaceum]